MVKLIVKNKVCETVYHINEGFLLVIAMFEIADLACSGVGVLSGYSPSVSVSVLVFGTEEDSRKARQEQRADQNFFTLAI